MKDILEKLTQIVDNNSFLRVDAIHPLDLYIGIDEYGQTTFLILSNITPIDLKSSILIDINVDKRIDLRNTISLSLKDENYKDIFVYFINEIIESSRRYTADNGYRFVLKRINRWQAMLSKLRPGTMSITEIKGLLGELIVLDRVIAIENNYNYAVKGWIGSEGAKQDFVFENSWVEVKSTNSGSPSVIISSIEQLDTNTTGELIVVNLDKSSELDELAFNINEYIEQISKKIEELDVLEQFQMMLIKRGYHYNKVYDSIRFRLGDIRKYIVDESFPCLRRGRLPSSIIECKYEISLLSIIDKQIGGQ